MLAILGCGAFVFTGLVRSCFGEDPGYDKVLIECTARGVAYFKDIGSYPTLKSFPNEGRNAHVVAQERCSRSLSAFP